MADMLVDGPVACQNGQLEPKGTGYFAANGSAWTLVFGKDIVGTEGLGVYRKLVAVGMMPLSPWSALRSHSAFP